MSRGISSSLVILLVASGCAPTDAPKVTRDADAGVQPAAATEKPGPGDPEIQRLPEATVPVAVAAEASPWEMVIPVRVCVDARGQVTFAAIDTSKPARWEKSRWEHLVDSTAIAVAQQGTYRPGNEDGIPKPGCLVVEIVFNRGKKLIEPKLISMDPPIYPDNARRSGEEGMVLVRTLVDKQGFVAKAVIIQSAGVGIDQSALEAVGTARFAPAVFEGKHVELWMVIPIEYDLHDN